MQGISILQKTGLMKKVIFGGLILMISVVAFPQQDPQFSQYMFNLTSVNPAYVGSSDMIALSLINRQQWVGFDGAPGTSFFQANAPVNPFGIKSGVGLSIMNDRIAFNKDLGISGYYAYRLDIGQGTLGIGLSLGLINKALDATWDIPASELGSGFTEPASDNAIPEEKESRMAFDMGFGLYFNTENLYFGLSTTHLNQPQIKYVEKNASYISRHYYAVAGYRFQMPNPTFEILPSVILKTDGKVNQIDVSALVRYNKKFWGGVSYRAGDAVIGILGIEMFNGVRIGYSYDFTTSDIGNYSDGSHEFTVAYSFNLSLEKTPQKYRSIRFL
jgi:type IX secretion system PorP/SprF family membrane protein